MGAPLSQNTAAAEEAAWQHGRAAFILTDSQGKHGKPGQRYLAWRLPNICSGPHIPLGRGRQRHLNRQLGDLRRYGDAGNSPFGGACAELVEVLSAGRLREDAFCQRRYTANGALAGRQPETAAYWRGRGVPGTAVWYVLSNADWF